MVVSPPSRPVREVEASVGQRLLWLLDHYRGGDGTINVPIVWRIRGPLDVAVLSLAIDQLAARHETLRTTYVQRARRLFQLVHEPHPVELVIHDLSGEPAAEAAALTAMELAARTDMDPTVAALSATLWRIARDDHLLLLGIHHLATDFFSNMILTRDLGWLYDRTVGATDEELPALPWSYAEWSEWQRRAFAEGRLERLRAFWKDELAGAQAITLPRSADGGPRLETTSEPSAGEQAGKTTLDLDPAVIDRLGAVARGLRTTLFPVMLGAFHAHLYRLSGQRDLSVSSLFTNRMRPEVQDAVGFFVNMIVLRGRVDPSAGFGELARASRSTVVRALGHADLPYQMLPPRTLGARADDVVFQYLEAPAQRRRSLDVEVVDITVNSGRFALELVVYNHEHLMLRCNRDFDEQWSRRLLAGYGDLLGAIADAPQAPLTKLIG